MTEDQELTVLTSTQKALEPLDDEARRRVLGYLVSRYGATPPLSVKGVSKGAVAEREEFEDVHALYDAADPKTGPERALVVGYWLQEYEKQGDLEGQPVNDVLKDKGVGLKNITAAMTSLANRKPALVRQVQKSGPSQQARKKYRLTKPGIEAVKNMVAGRHLDEE